MPNTGWLWWCRYIQVDKSTKTTLRICKKQQLEICLASPLNCYIQTIVIFKSRIECWVTFRVLYQDQWQCFPISETDPFEWPYLKKVVKNWRNLFTQSILWELKSYQSEVIDNAIRSPQKRLNIIKYKVMKSIAHLMHQFRQFDGISKKKKEIVTT